MRRTNQPHQLAYRVDSVSDAQPGRRNSELAIHRRDSQVRLHRDREPAAQAKAADARDYRLCERGELGASAAGQPVVFLLCVSIGALLLELADIRTRDKRFVARSVV